MNRIFGRLLLKSVALIRKVGRRRLQESIRKETGTEEAKDLYQRLPPKSSSNEPLKIQSFK